MKKIFTLICALTAVFATAQAQDVVFTYGGEVLEEGAEVTAQAVDWTEFGMGFMVDSNTPEVLEVKNTGASSTRVSVNVKVVEGDYARIQWCGITTQCQKMASTTETRSTTLAAGASTRLNLDTEFHEGEYGVRSVLVTATANGESVSMTFHMENKAPESGNTKTYTDDLVVTINGMSTPAQQSDIKVVMAEDGTSMDLSLNNFSLSLEGNVMAVGNILLEDVQLIESGNYKVFRTTQTINITAGDDPDQTWLGPMLGDVPIVMVGKINDGKLFCAIDIDMREMLQQVICVSFGSDIAGGEDYAESVVSYQNDAVVESTAGGVNVEMLNDGTMLLSLKDYSLYVEEEGLFPLGNIMLSRVKYTTNGKITEFSGEEDVIFKNGTPNDMGWFGSVLGFVPTKVSGKLDGDKFYCTIEMATAEMLGANLKIVVGAADNVTNISSVAIVNNNVSVYRPDGTLVHSGAWQSEILKMLPKGLYIVNGKKIIK